jgi:hypothetical protein
MTGRISASLAICAMIAFTACSLRGHDLGEVEVLLTQEAPNGNQVVRATASKLLSAAISDPALSYKDFRQAPNLVEVHQLVEVIPTLVQHVDREGYRVGSMKPWTIEYPCTRTLVKFGLASVDPILLAALHEKDRFRQKLLVYSLLGVLGPPGAFRLLNESLKNAPNDESRKRASELIELANTLAPGAPTHLSPVENSRATVNPEK